MCKLCTEGTKTKHSSPNCPVHSSAGPAEPCLGWLWGTQITAPTPSGTSSSPCRSRLHDFTSTYIHPPPPPLHLMLHSSNSSRAMQGNPPPPPHQGSQTFVP